MKRKKTIKILIFVFSLLLFTFGCMCFTGYLIHKKEQQRIEAELQAKLEEEEKNKKYPLVVEDFEKGLLSKNYILLNGNIEESTIQLSLKNISNDNYVDLCMNLNNIMKNYQQTKLNSNQQEFVFYLYEKNNNSLELSDANKILKYKLNADNFKLYYDKNIPEIELADGLLPYTLISFNNNEMFISMNTEHLSLYDKISQMKTLQEIVMSLNNLTQLDMALQENNIIYKYKYNASIIEIIETVKLEKGE